MTSTMECSCPPPQVNEYFFVSDSCKPTGGDASVRDAKNWMGAWDSKAKNCPADSDHLLISDTEERSVCALGDETRVVGWV